MHKLTFPSFTRWVKGLGISVFVILAIASVVSAQTQITTGTIQGTVTDANGAIVPGANVEIKNLDTNFSKTLTTDDGGRFVALALPPGNYSVAISKKGFATTVVEKAALTVGQALNLPLSMKVSGVEERVTVNAPTVDTVKTESSSTLNETTVSTTPILGRKFEDLLTLTPGVSVVQGPDGDEITFAGQRGIFNNISLDGGDYNNGFFGEQAGGQRAAIDIPLDAVKEFQVVATGASAEFGRTAGGVINVISKSGTNDVHGSVFHFQRLKALTANTSDGKPLRDFRREQFGGTVGGPIRKNKAFFFFAFEGISENLTRPNLSEPIGTPCPVSAPTILANEALINANTDCQRLALINFLKATQNQDDGQPVKHPIRNNAFLSKVDWDLNSKNKLAVSYNFDYSKNTNQTFDVATYGTSANGIEGPSKINVVNLNLFSTVSPTTLNEAHFTYSRESRPRSATPSNIPADTAAGFATTFRFGNPFFLGPNIDELMWRTQVRDNFSIVRGRHTAKFGGEWLHTINDQIFRGFFEGRYIFDSVTGFLRYASPSLGAGFGPTDAAAHLLLFLQGASRTGPATDAAGASRIKNEDFALFAQDRWQVRPNVSLSYGLRWEAQIFPGVVVPPSQTAYGIFLSDPRFPSDGTLHSQKKQFQPRVGLAWDIGGKGRSVLRASSNIYYGRQNMLTQVGSITTNGVQQQTIAGGLFANPTIHPTWPNLVTPAAGSCGPPTNPFPCFSGVRVFSKDYANPRIYTANVAFEQELVPNLAMYFDFTWSKGVHLTRFVNTNNGGTPLPITSTTNQDTVSYSFPGPFNFDLGDVFVTASSAKSLYRGFTAGLRKRFSHGFQMEANYVLAKDLDDDSNERDPFLDRTFNRFDFSKDYSVSDRDIRHKFNFYTYAELPAGFQANFRIQARSAQPITDNPLGNGSGSPCSPSNSRTRIVNGIDCGRNHLRKDNRFFSFDWRVMRPFKFHERYALIPTIEMFNTFNNANNINPLVTPGLFNFDGFLRQGVGDPRQVQLAVKFTF
ncbi:MAG TPA: carboxypeptidase regulatory-like domain-containing protein [Pyrinomonadaceae bacterium]|nr:carboxypeptidase regulatory-like domain-containing protein [Pyrinomonadaceae bacterium]